MRTMMPSITLFNDCEDVLYQGVLYRLPLCEGEILAMGRSLYGDGEMCVMRREAVKRRIYMKLEERLLEKGFEGRITLADLGELGRYVDVGGYSQWRYSEKIKNGD